MSDYTRLCKPLYSLLMRRGRPTTDEGMERLKRRLSDACIETAVEHGHLEKLSVSEIFERDLRYVPLYVYIPERRSTDE